MSDPTPKAPLSLLVALVVAMAMGPVFNFGMSALAPEIVDAYDITEGQFGLLITVLFLAAGLSATLLGVLADRLSARAQLLIIHLGTALAFIIAATGDNYGWLIVAVIISGIAQAQSNPVTNRIVATEVPRASRSGWMGAKQSGVQVGLLFAGVTFPLVGLAFGWSGAAIFGAALTIPAIVLSWVVTKRLRQPTASTRTAAANEAASQRPSAAMWLFPVASFLNAAGTQGFNGFAALFAVRAVDLPLTVAGCLLSIIGVIGIIGRIGWGRVAGKRERPAQLLAIMSIGGIVTMLILIAADQTGQAWLLWLAVPLHAALPLAANVVINSGIVAAVPPARVGVASGLVATGMYLGFALGPLIVGSLVDLTGAYTAGWAVLAGTYLGCTIIAIVLYRVLEQGKS
ncbi:MFS transporter [Gulosibacter macacae]|uniref:MFS transporter n=1 Tax=Gulosibacter macacae TaxID=2488791 RepID=A0A3P3W0J6_9MICO|nr:MFS transporter [Gulosibacter macacae]RRJ88304.1 MFS transporter [Gulosibacter macacae]